MKDKVFIAWSGSNTIAIMVKKILENRFNYVCAIGGNADNNSQFSSIGDTVIQQIKSCNQAIVVFQNRHDGAVSNNLFFELGYVLSMYGTKKIHCVKRADESVVLPSDFDNSFVEPISGVENDEEFAEKIVDYFMSRQKMSINENKMFLINNRYLIHDKIKAHYSTMGSKCSDYELAQYILFYMQAAHMFGDISKVQKEIFELKQLHNFEFSDELSLSVNICLSFFDLVSNVKNDSVTSDVYIDQNVFWKFKNDYKHYSEQITDDDTGIFDEWANVFIHDHLAYGHVLFASNPEISDDLRRSLHKMSNEYATECLTCIGILEQRAPCKENNDETGLISLIKSYAYCNIYLSKHFLKEVDENDYLIKTLKERESLKNNYIIGSIDTQLYNNFCMQYYLALISYLTYNKVDEFELLMYKNEISEYLNSVKKDKNENAYIKQISQWCTKNS